LAESFFATLECELINRRSWKTQAEARMALFIWIEGWYNPRRRHSALNYQSPITFERKHHHNTVGVEHGLPTASVGSSQATTEAVDNPAPVQSSTCESSQYLSVGWGQDQTNCSLLAGHY
jgi:putative transposase